MIFEVSTLSSPASKHRSWHEDLQELKGIEYGCTVDAVSLLIPAMQRKRANQESTPTVARWLTEFLVVILVANFLKFLVLV